MIAKAFLPLALCLVPTALALAQTVTPTASISGVVMTDEPVSRPLRMVSVMIESGDIRLPESTVTDDAGGFTLANLPAGNYSLSASKPGYVPSYYGGKRPGRGPGVPIAVLAGQHVTAITLQMLHGSVITGIVTHRTGQPAARSRVEAKPVQITNGTTQQVGGSGYGTTDDRGRYRIFGLAPGDYVVQAMSESFDVSEVRRVMAAEIQWGERVTSPGGAPVDGIGPAALPPAPASGRTVKYADVFYPGTVDAAAAVAVSLGRNEERDGVDFSTSLVPTAVVRGVVLDADGQPSIGAQVRATPRQTDASSPLGSFLSLLGTSAQSFAPDGRFALSAMEPGQYTITARAAPRSAAGETAGPVLTAPATGRGASPPPARTLWAMEDVGVNGEDVASVTLRLQPGMTISGKLVFESSTLTPPADLSRVIGGLRSMPTGGSPGDYTPVKVADDGTFSATGVTPGQYGLRFPIVPGMLLNPNKPGAGWVLKSMTWNGRDVADLPLEVTPNRDVTGVVATFTDRPTEFSGTLRDRADRIAPGYPIVVFSTDRRYWTRGSRRVQQIRPASDGTFTLLGLPAGEYYVCAVTDLDPNALTDMPFLDGLAAVAVKVTLADGEKQTQNLKLAGGG